MMTECGFGHPQIIHDGGVCPACELGQKLYDAERALVTAKAENEQLLDRLTKLEEDLKAEECRAAEAEEKITGLEGTVDDLNAKIEALQS